jgi:hypothetical protein
MRSAYKDAKGELFVEEPGAGMIRSRIVGYMTAGLAQAFLKHLEAAMKRSAPVRIAHDWSEMPNYEGEARTLFIDFLMKHRKETGETIIFARSAMVNLGINTASLALKAVGVTVSATGDARVFQDRVTALFGKKAA